MTLNLPLSVRTAVWRLVKIQLQADPVLQASGVDLIFFDGALTRDVFRGIAELAKLRKCEEPPCFDFGTGTATEPAEEAVAECERSGNSISVAVVDRAGRLRVFLQGDKASPHNIELARRKAEQTLVAKVKWAAIHGLRFQFFCDLS